MRTFEPIAIIGQGCVLPGCQRPSELWRAVHAGRSLLSSLPPDGWRLDAANYLRAAPGIFASTPVRTDIGGFVTATAAQLSLDRLALSRAEIEELDPVVQWSIHAAAQARADAKLGRDAIAPDRGGVILGNLSYPTRSLTRFFEHVALGPLAEPGRPPAALNRFMSGLPALLTARALGLRGPAFCLDAACASGLYAIKLACDKLQRRECDLMFAGGVNASDPLFIFSGFATVHALSQTGRSRPFHREADGLVPSEGAALVVLKRLADAERAGDTIAGVIRGVGLSNDGRAGGFLSPSASGQERALRMAFDASGGLTPADVSLVECHATGTAAGDGVELRALEAVYGRRDDLHLTALKANLGHSITTAAAAGVLKTLAALKHGVIPPTPNAFPTLPQIGACGYHVHERAAEWTTQRHPVAAISAFGMGGNNAHLLLERWAPKRTIVAPKPAATTPIAIVALAVRTDACEDLSEFGASLLQGAPSGKRTPADAMTVEFDPKTLTSPPVDLRRALGQQLLLLETALAVLASDVALEPDTTGVFVGMQADAGIARHTLRARIGEILRRAGHSPDEAWLDGARQKIEEPLVSAHVVGTMPNMPANRLHQQFDVRGPGFTVSAEENSGIAALQIAIDALQAGEIATAIVGAVDLSREACQQAAAAATGFSGPAADAAVVLVLKSLAAAERAGDRIVATVASRATSGAVVTPRIASGIFGHAHAAAGLLEVAAAALAAQQSARLDPLARKLVPLLGEQRARASEIISAPSCAPEFATTVSVRRPASGGAQKSWLPEIVRFAGDSVSDLRRRLEHDERGGDGPCRAAWVISSAADAAAKRTKLQAWLTARETKHERAAPPEGIHFQAAPMGGDLAFAFTGAAAAYPGMGRELLVGLPKLLEASGPMLGRAQEFGGWIFENSAKQRPDPFLQLAGGSLLCQLHARFTQEVLGLRPKAMLGLSSGETNGTYALGIWSQPETLFDDIRESGLYSTHLGGEFRSVRQHWGEREGFVVEWENWHVRAPIDAVREALADEPRAYLTIINTADECVIGGDRAACRRVLARIGSPQTVPLGYDMAVHCAPVLPFEPEWRRLHTRPTRAVEGVRVYSNFFGAAYQPTETSVADALTGQALVTIDLPKIVELAWRDGARVFVEHGPRDHVTSAISAILGDRPHVVVALDVAGRSSLGQAAQAAGALWAAGIEVRWDDFAAAPSAKPNKARMRFPVRPPALALPPLPSPATIEAPATPPCPTRVLPRPPDLLPVSAAAALRSAAETTVAPPATVEQRILANFAAAHRDYLDRQTAAWRIALAQQQALHQLALTLVGGSADIPSAFLSEAHATPALPSSTPAPQPSRRNPWEVPSPLAPRGPRFDRPQLETLASGKISSVFGPRFAEQDDFAVQVRMPEPPLLLCDRVLGIEGAAGSMGPGIIWTETDVREGSWYLHCGRMPGGLFIEAGQADLLLISWLGVDFLNRGERAYRLLGCELMFHEALPKVGDTLRYQIHVDRHANQGAVRLFFFHYDCWIDGKPRISVREGQAGFFTPAELANSGGVLWSAEGAAYSEPAHVEIPEQAATKTAYSADHVEAFARGELETCFGPTFDWGWTHSRTPSIPPGRHNLIGEITHLDPRGGPAGRGYLKAVRRLSPDDWFFKGHFKNDPCMPGTLMAEGCLQAMTFYLVALGFSRDRDGWRSEPVPDTKYSFVCRGQATPESRELVYELFVDEVRFVGDQPTLFAHVLCTVDGLKAFKCERLGLRLVKDFPLTSLPRSTWERPARLPVAEMDGVTLDYKSILACALGHPVDAFGPRFAPFTKMLRAPRLPNPPFLFCTHVARVGRTPEKRESKAFVDILYDLEDDAWYFAENSSRVLTLCATMEIALQACGWLASYVLEPEFAVWEPLFRNLDGVGTQFREIRPGDGTIETKVQLTSRVVLGEQIVVRFHVRCMIGDELVFECRTTFGSFTPAALADTKGMIPAAAELAAVKQPGNTAFDVAAARERYRLEKRFALPGPRLLRLDRVTGLWPRGGAHGLGYIRAEKDVRKRDWVFKAHFFQDPVQPGSIGVESVLQAVKLFMLETEEIPDGLRPEFESVLVGKEFEWMYRGQVLPRHRLVTVDFDVRERTPHDDGVTITGEGRLWVDGKKIYHLTRFGTRMRLVPESKPGGVVVPPASLAQPGGDACAPREEAFGTINLPALRRVFSRHFGAAGPVWQDLFLGLIQQFVAGIELEDAADYHALRGRPVLYLANHQVGVESVLFVALVDLLNPTPCRAIAKREHKDSWIGRMMHHVHAHSGRDSMLFFDRADPNHLLQVLGGMIGSDGRPTHSLLAHVQGTRSLRAGEPITQVSAALLDFALRCDLPIVPVRFVGGLPRTPVAQRLEFPVGFGRQRYIVGRALSPAELAALHLRDRKAFVIDALNRTGPTLDSEDESAPDPEFEQRVAKLRREAELSEVSATLLACLERVPGRCQDTETLVAAVRGARRGSLTSEFTALLTGMGIQK